jgi:hypothetical protein
MQEAQFKNALEAFDRYNSNDPNKERADGQLVAKELLYSIRMTDCLLKYFHEAAVHLQLAARSQHIGRWEIARSQFPMDKKGYFQWRNKLKVHHAAISVPILNDCGIDDQEVQKVKALILKKEPNNPDMQILEDVICLVFLEFYCEEFATKHSDEKVVDILRKTMKKMSASALNYVASIRMSDKLKSMIHEASTRP